MRPSKLSPVYRCAPLLILMACAGDANFTGVKAPPAVSIQEPAGGSFTEGSGIEFVGRVSDDEDPVEDLLVEWSSDRDGIISEQSADAEGHTSFATSMLSVGNHVVTLRATDSDATVGEDWIELTITDLADAPTIEIRAPENSDVGYEGEASDFEVLVGDLQDPVSSLTITFSSDADGEFCSPVADDLGIAACEYALSAGDHVLTFRVKDSDDNVAEATTYFEVLSGANTDDDNDGFTEQQGDCDDAQPLSHPGADEVNDGADNDCDGDIDEGLSSFDDDGDCFCEADECTGSIDAGCANVLGGDCDDGNDNIYPDAVETCDEVDNDCDDLIDEAGAEGSEVWYRDKDGDLYGNAQDSIEDCEMPTGFVTDSGDCNDNSASVYPSASETAGDDVDQDCDSVDSCYTDADNDGYGIATVVDGLTLSCVTDANLAAVSGDCDDSKSSIKPTATETVADGIDQDCDLVDSCYQDNDNDAYGSATVVDGSTLSCANDAYRATVSTDCNDASSSIKPLATETVADGVDQDCDNVDSCYFDIDNDGYGTATVIDGFTTNCTTDSYRSILATDCNDGNAAAYPGSAETVADSVDQDCDGVDSCYYDYDDDGYGSTSATIMDGYTLSCATDANRATVATDCNDQSSGIRPNATELAGDNVDQNCDSKETCYTDNDNDGYKRSPATTFTSSDADCNDSYEAISTDGDDCNDGNAAIKPGVNEITGDSVDQNCDGAEMCYRDADNDGYRPGTSLTTASTDTDCNDAYEATSLDPTTDCGDANSNARPNQTSYFTATYTNNNGSASWDYDCDGASEKEWTAVYSCDSYYDFPDCAIGSHEEGWLDGSVPSCGASELVGYGISTYWDAWDLSCACEEYGTYTEVQGCQ